MKTAVVTGVRGQDGAYLSKLLLEKGYRVVGFDRRSSDDGWRLKEIGVDKDVEFMHVDLGEPLAIYKTIEKLQPDELYNLAAQSFVGVSFSHPLQTADIDALGVTRLLEAIRHYSPKTKFYQASTSEMFGKVQAIPQTETTPFYPRSPYGVAKLYGHWITVNYRESYDLFACSGILFNHESPLRGIDFVTRKITANIAAIRAGQIEKFQLGNLNSKRDWGYAREYVEGMYLMLQQEKPDDFVLSTGNTYTIREFADLAFKAADFSIEWSGKDDTEKATDKKTGKVILEVSKDFYRPAEVDLLLGNPEKAFKKLQWKAKMGIEQLAQIMVEADIARVEGKRPKV